MLPAPNEPLDGRETIYVFAEIFVWRLKLRFTSADVNSYKLPFFIEILKKKNLPKEMAEVWLIFINNKG